MTSSLPRDPRYRRPCLDNVEKVEKYQKGGLHPIHIGDNFKDGRYCILHKLGYGGFSTVWLARDNHQDELVSLKVLTAEASLQRQELLILRHLDGHIRSDLRRNSIIVVFDDFIIEGPNGAHLCLVSQAGGPNISMISDSPGEIGGTRRLCASLARKLARQLVDAVGFLHDRGVVHGDITPRNVLLRLRGIDTWSTESIYKQLGPPMKEDVFSFSGGKPDDCAPQYLVESVSFSQLDSHYISHQALLIDLGEAFLDPSPPMQGVGTPVSYCSPELMLEKKASKASDIWALACTVFAIRAGCPLFESFLGSSDEVLEEIVRIVGPLPEPLRHLGGKTGLVSKDHGQWNGSVLMDHIKEIGVYDQESFEYDDSRESRDYHTLREPLGEGIGVQEATDPTDLLRGMLDYSPGDRLSAEEVAKHPWFRHASYG
ncbi:MAG: hypothetical protein Q9195_001687 [Heterodermia aff. obscurata]